MNASIYSLDWHFLNCELWTTWFYETLVYSSQKEYDCPMLKKTFGKYTNILKVSRGPAVKNSLDFLLTL